MAAICTLYSSPVLAQDNSAPPTTSAYTAAPTTADSPPMQARTQTYKYKSQVGRMYFVSKYRGLPGSPPRYLTRTELENVTYFDQVCQGDLKAQRPTGVSEYFHTTVFGALGAGGGYAAGYGAAGYDGQQIASGAKLGLGFGLFSGLVQGIDGRMRANRYDLGQCVMQMVSWAQQLDHTMLGVFIVINSHAVNGKGMKRMTVADNDNMSWAPPAANDNSTAAPATAARPVIIN
ncbi:MAG TPA: hypothetical protein VN086_02540 [Candidatus Paceibacterota bacterium]|nr:hypothetical protein [Candidatus Paceibacterota bacterium]